MIRIELTFAALLYVSLSLVLLLIWFFFEEKRKFTRARSPEESLWHCPTCFDYYIDSHSESISQCPRCSALHKRSETAVLNG